MNEQKFVYEHFYAASYTVLGVGLVNAGVFFGLKHPAFFWPLTPLLILGLAAVTFAFIRSIKLSRTYKNIPSKEGRKIIKRYRYSLNWVWPIIGLSLSVSYLASLFYELHALEYMSIFVATFAATQFALTRMFLGTLQSKIDHAALSP